MIYALKVPQMELRITKEFQTFIKVVVGEFRVRDRNFSIVTELVKCPGIQPAGQSFTHVIPGDSTWCLSLTCQQSCFFLPQAQSRHEKIQWILGEWKKIWFAQKYGDVTFKKSWWSYVLISHYYCDEDRTQQSQHRALHQVTKPPKPKGERCLQLSHLCSCPDTLNSKH